MPSPKNSLARRFCQCRGLLSFHRRLRRGAAVGQQPQRLRHLLTTRARRSQLAPQRRVGSHALIALRLHLGEDTPGEIVFAATGRLLSGLPVYARAVDDDGAHRARSAARARPPAPHGGRVAGVRRRDVPVVVGAGRAPRVPCSLQSILHAATHRLALNATVLL